MLSNRQSQEHGDGMERDQLTMEVELTVIDMETSSVVEFTVCEKRFEELGEDEQPCAPKQLVFIITQ